MTEHNQAILIANRLLDHPPGMGDPDSDQCVLARQYLRALEQVEVLRSYTVTPLLEYDY